MSGSGPSLSLPPWREHTVCAVCPSLVLRLGEFDVAPRPSRDSNYDPTVDYRVTPAGVGVCVHPEKLGLPPGLYASRSEPVPPPAWAGEPEPDPEPPMDVLPPLQALSTLNVPSAPSPQEDEADDEWFRTHPAPPVPEELLAWLRQRVAEAVPDDLVAALGRAEESARQRWSAETVVEAMRRVLSGG